MCGFVAQLVAQRTGNAEVTGSNHVEALIFFQAVIILHLHLQPQFKNELFHVYFTAILSLHQKSSKGSWQIMHVDQSGPATLRNLF